MLIPGPGTKEVAVCNCAKRGAQGISGGKWDGISPPDLNGCEPDSPISRILQDEEDQHRTNCNTRVERGGKYVVVLCPPREMTPSDDVLEDESNNSPRHIVDGACGWDRSCPRENNWEVEIAKPAVGELQAEEIGDDRADKTDEEEQDQSIVDLSLGELSSWPNNTPNNTSCAEDLC